ncbi:hypothetical protein OTU49_017534 [Cherax quadricarinatus]|uniref:LIM zinc-binding domain-containing protein n=2 Tax=Cherax quadricarinatus TaxID=27406 RepID=A0AAW0Y6G6_CHEQU
MADAEATDAAEGEACVDQKGRRHRENGVSATTTDKKKKKSEDGEKKSKKKKKKKKGESEKENMKARYQYRDDLLAKHVGPRVRSFDATKMKNKFEKPKQATQVSSECKMCGKQVFQMEKIVAEKASWHKNCFRCKECNSLLTLETYQSHEGVLYCKPHFKDLFRPKAVIEDPDEARRDRLMRRPKMIVLESQPQALPDDVVRSTDKPDYGLEDLSAANLKQKFAMFELISTEEEQRPEPIPVRRSQSLLNRAAKFMHSDDDDYGVENAELGEYEEYDEEEDEEQDDEEGEEDDEEHGDQAITKKGRPTSFSGLHDLKAGWLQKNRREELSRKRREDLSKFRQMLCAGKNITTREMFESGNFEDQDKRPKRKEPIAIEGRPAAKNLREKFERGLSMDEDENHERREVDDVLKNAETASKARNLFKKIDSAVSEEGSEVVMRPRSSAQARKENRLSREGKRIRNFTSQVHGEQSQDGNDDEVSIENSSLVNRFKFFATYEERVKQEEKKRRKVFRFTPPRDSADKGIDVEEQELGRDPNLIRCTDNYEDEVDCRKTRSVLEMFKRMEMQSEEEEDRGPRPLKRFTPPPEGEGDDDSEEDEDSDEEYSDEDEEEDSEEDDEDDDDETERKPKYKDEILEMVNARKAASLRAKFEKWESEVERNNEYNRGDIPEGDEECMPSIDTARNLRAMFENKAQEASRPVTNRPKIKVNRFV